MPASAETTTHTPANLVNSDHTSLTAPGRRPASSARRRRPRTTAPNTDQTTPTTRSERRIDVSATAGLGRGSPEPSLPVRRGEFKLDFFSSVPYSGSTISGWNVLQSRRPRRSITACEQVLMAIVRAKPRRAPSAKICSIRSRAASVAQPWAQAKRLNASRLRTRLRWASVRNRPTRETPRRGERRPAIECLLRP